MTTYVRPDERLFENQAVLGYDEGYKEGQKDAAPALILGFFLAGISGFTVGAGVVGALVAIF